MSDYVIKVENLGKSYQIRHKQESYTALRDVLTDGAKNAGRALLHRNNGQVAETREEFWALKDVSFEVKQGERLGIIGRNGAGKSTLLKILSRITQPTSGEVRLRGRVASLLEVGTGFHPELTGRENIYLNGAILGMTREEIRRKFDEIVAFAEVERFLDTPVKRYSSGMYVRLAFAVAAHLEPEILLVDEVLAVGDNVFQEKCLGKMKDVSQSEGRTVLFVSHNLGAIESLCQTAILMENGRNAFYGMSGDVVSRYLKKVRLLGKIDSFEGCVRQGTGQARITGLEFQDENAHQRTEFKMGQPVVIVMEIDFPEAVENPTVGINILTDTGVLVADCRSSHSGLESGSVRGRIEYVMRVDRILLYPRTYIVEPWVADAGVFSEYDWVRNAAAFVVVLEEEITSGALVDSRHGISYIPTSWQLRQKATSDL
jgi:lipopolysaccharide transport system ATP-binding protein